MIKQAPHIKICGLRDAATIQTMNHLPITEVGLVFAPSRRQVTIEQGQVLVQAIKQLSCRDGKAPKAVGVFVNYPIQQMRMLLDEVSLDIIQLHGQEDLAYYEELHALSLARHVEIWKVISISPESGQLDMEKQQLEPFIPYVTTILLDAPGGGTGKTFNWNAIELFRTVVNRYDKQLIVAGGLHESNVSELISTYAIDGLDVSSGVETDGVKDIHKIEQFVRKVIEG